MIWGQGIFSFNTRAENTSPFASTHGLSCVFADVGIARIETGWRERCVQDQWIEIPADQNDTIRCKHER